MHTENLEPEMIGFQVFKSIRQITEINNEHWQQEHEGVQSTIWASELGFCPRKSWLRRSGVTPTNPIPTHTLMIMQEGTWMEEKTFQELSLQMDVERNRRVNLDGWSGRVDFWIELENTMVEHKYTSIARACKTPPDYQFLQTMFYRKALTELYGWTPKSILFVRTRIGFLEAELIQGEAVIYSSISGQTWSKQLPDLDAEMKRLKEATEETPTLGFKDNQCSRGANDGERSVACKYFSACYPGIDLVRGAQNELFYGRGEVIPDW